MLRRFVSKLNQNTKKIWNKVLILCNSWHKNYLLEKRKRGRDEEEEPNAKKSSQQVMPPLEVQLLELQQSPPQYRSKQQYRVIQHRPPQQATVLPQATVPTQAMVPRRANCPQEPLGRSESGGSLRLKKRDDKKREEWEKTLTAAVTAASAVETEVVIKEEEVMFDEKYMPTHLFILIDECEIVGDADNTNDNGYSACQCVRGCDANCVNFNMRIECIERFDVLILKLVTFFQSTSKLIST
jgi:hypothetical protein